MNSRLTLEPLETLGCVDDLAGLGIGFVQRPELLRFRVAIVCRVEGTGQGNVLPHDRRWHRLGDAFSHGVRESQNTCTVFDGCLRLDGGVGDDLGYSLFAVFLRGVADHVRASAFVEIDVDIRHRDAFGIQESLEEQPVFDRIEFGDAQRESDHGAGGRPSAWADSDLVVTGVANEISDHEEIAGESHLSDNTELVLRLLADIVGNRSLVPGLQSTLNLCPKPGLFGVPVGHRELRHQVGSFVEGDLASLRDQQRVVACLGKFGPNRTHFGSGLQVEVPGVKSKPLGVVHRRPRPDTQQHLVGIRI